MAYQVIIKKCVHTMVNLFAIQRLRQRRKMLVPFQYPTLFWTSLISFMQFLEVVVL